jgi:hypothetical protein
LATLLQVLLLQVLLQAGAALLQVLLLLLLHACKQCYRLHMLSRCRCTS